MTAKLTATLRRFVRDEQGASMAEYALLVAAVAVAAAIAARLLGTNVRTKFEAAATTIGQ